jgi:hypothetical protein
MTWGNLSFKTALQEPGNLYHGCFWGPENGKEDARQWAPAALDGTLFSEHAPFISPIGNQDIIADIFSGFGLGTV